MFANYTNVQKLDFGFKNQLYAGYLGSQKVFIKQYVIRAGREREDALKVQTEFDCYQHIRTLALPKIIEANPNQHYLVLEWLDFKPFSSDHDGLKVALDLWQYKLRQVESDFLPFVDYTYYTDNLFRRLCELGVLQIVPFFERVMARMRAVETELTRGFRTFSHGDFYPGNLKLHNGVPMLFDFEHAHQDCPFYDLACLAVHFFGTPEAALLDSFTAGFKAHDQELYAVMQLRRSIDILYAFKNHQEMIGFGRAQKLIAELV